MSEYLDTKLTEYLYTLKLTPATKQKHKEAISDFFALLIVRDREYPAERDYDDFGKYLIVNEKKNLADMEREIGYIKRFFSWLAKNPNHNDIQPEQPLQPQKTHRVTTVLTPYLYEGLQILAHYDDMEIPTILKNLVIKYVAYRKHDIERVKDYELSIKGMTIAGANTDMPLHG